MADIPFKPITIKTLKGFPELYKIQAKKIIRDECIDAVNITADTMICAALLVLIEEFDFGTNERATRIPIFIERLQEIVDTSALYYDDAVAIGLRNRLHAHGVVYKLRGENNTNKDT